MRKNAGRGLALITELVHEIAVANQPNAVGAIGHIDVYPNSRNIIPGQVVCTVDMRTHLLDKLNGMVSEFEERAPKICKDIEVDFECSIVGQFDPPAFDENCVNAVENGVRGVVILDGRKPHSILHEIFSDKGSGTLIRE